MGNDRSGQSNSTTYGQGSSSTATPGSSTSGSTYGQSGSGSSGSTYGQSGSGSSTGSASQTNPNSGSTYGQSGTGSSGSTYGQSGTGSSTGTGQSSSTQSDSSMGTSGSRGSMDRSASAGSSANLKSAVGRVSKVDSDAKSIIISSRQGDRITLTVDDSTQIVDSSGGSSSDLSSLREGSQVRASFDPASNRAQRIEVMGKANKKGMHKRSGSSSDTTSSVDQPDSSMKAKTPNPNTAKSPAQDTTGTPSNSSDQKQ